MTGGGFADDRAIAISLFFVFITCCLFLCMWASPDLRHEEDGFYTEGASPGSLRNGIALTGDFVHAAGVLYLLGVVAVSSYDGVLLVLAAALSPLLLKVWLAERLPEGPGWSFGDVLARRLPAGPARRAAALAALVTTVPMLVAQFVPIGQITAALIGMPGENGEIAGIAIVGSMMVACAAIGGVRSAGMLQIGKTVGLLCIAPALVLLVLAHFDWSFSGMLEKAAHNSRLGDAYLAPGQLFGTSGTGMLDTFSLGVTVVLGAAFLPHLMMRLTASAGVKDARRTASWAAGCVALLCSTAVILGYGMQALVGARELNQAGPRGGNNILLLAAALDGSRSDEPGALLTFISCAAFLTVLASVAVLLLAGSAALVRDLGRSGSTSSTGGTSSTGSSGRSGRADAEAGRVPGAMARLALVAVGALAIVLAVEARSTNAQFWLCLSYSEAASAVLPALCYGLLWKRFNVSGLRWAVYGGTLVTIVLMAFSPAVSGSADALFPHADWHLTSLNAPGLFSIPAGFALGLAGTLARRPQAARHGHGEGFTREQHQPVG